MPIATIGTTLKITPSDELQILHASGDYEFIDDPTPFTMRVETLLHEHGLIIGVAGPVTSGPDRYTDLVTTLLTRLDDSQWESDAHSAANFRVGKSAAYRIPDFPHTHPEGAAIDAYPQIVRYGRVDQV